MNSSMRMSKDYVSIYKYINKYIYIYIYICNVLPLPRQMLDIAKALQILGIVNIKHYKFCLFVSVSICLTGVLRGLCCSVCVCEVNTSQTAGIQTAGHFIYVCVCVRALPLHCHCWTGNSNLQYVNLKIYKSLNCFIKFGICLDLVISSSFIFFQFSHFFSFLFVFNVIYLLVYRVLFCSHDSINLVETKSNPTNWILMVWKHFEKY